MPPSTHARHDGDLPPVSEDGLEPHDSSNDIDRVRVMLADSEARIHATVESIRSDLTSLEREVAVLASRSGDMRDDLEQFSGKFDNLAEQVHKLMGALEAKAAHLPPQQPAPVPKPADPTDKTAAALAVVNMQNIVATGLVVIAIGLAMILYAMRFGDDALERKLDRFPGTQRSEHATGATD